MMYTPRGRLKPAKLSFCTTCGEAIGLWRLRRGIQYWAHIDQEVLRHDPHQLTLTRMARFRAWWGL
jgi:hypothetical protein